MTDLSNPVQLIDRFGRTVDYLRISITDRCDFRCVYCMAEEMTFLPRAQILTLEEIVTLAKAFAELGVKKIRVTGGEPLVRKGALGLLENIGQIESLTELVITTNGSQLETMATALKEAGVNASISAWIHWMLINLRQSPERVIYSKYSEVFKPPGQSALSG